MLHDDNASLFKFNFRMIIDFQQTYFHIVTEVHLLKFFNLLVSFNDFEKDPIILVCANTK